MIKTCIQSTAAFLGAASLIACASSAPARGTYAEGEADRSRGYAAQPIGLYFSGLDADGNRITTRDELITGINADWAEFGRTPSAAIFSGWSVRSLGSNAARPGFLSFDTNLDGLISQAEFTQRLTQDFENMDKNGDNRLDRRELVRLIERRQERRANPRGDSDVVQLPRQRRQR